MYIFYTYIWIFCSFQILWDLFSLNDWPKAQCCQLVREPALLPLKVVYEFWLKSYDKYCFPDNLVMVISQWTTFHTIPLHALYHIPYSNTISINISPIWLDFILYSNHFNFLIILDILNDKCIIKYPFISFPILSEIPFGLPGLNFSFKLCKIGDRLPLFSWIIIFLKNQQICKQHWFDKY